MKRFLLVAAILAAIVLPVVLQAATLTWSVVKYFDNTALSAPDAATVIYTPYSGTSATGPWTAGTRPAAGALTATMPDPPVGGTLWYTVEATLGTQTGPKAPAVSKTILKSLGAPAIISIQ
jgi:hypothetical protein